MKKRSLLLLGAMVLVCLAGLMAVNAEDDEEKTKAKVWLGYRAHHRAVITGETGDLARFGSPSDTPSGSVLALMSLPRFAAGAADDALSLVPLYLGESLAEALLRKKETGDGEERDKPSGS